ncbi:MAG: hypothetical protein LBF58_09440 [Deltaproteobacteria bacterium]|jgi:hypothetical protein|nr:hypothetical protein [Deltaproteobacteria bacterium]
MGFNHFFGTLFDSLRHRHHGHHHGRPPGGRRAPWARPQGPDEAPGGEDGLNVAPKNEASREEDNFFSPGLEGRYCTGCSKVCPLTAMKCSGKKGKRRKGA